MKKWANALRKLYQSLKAAYNFLTPEQRAILVAQILLVAREARAMMAQAKKTKAAKAGAASRMLSSGARNRRAKRRGRR